MSESGKKSVKSLEDVVLSQVYLLEALVALLEEKGIVMPQELLEKVQELKSRRSS